MRGEFQVNSIVYADVVTFGNKHTLLENLSDLRGMTLKQIQKHSFNSNGFLINNEKMQILTFSLKMNTQVKLLGILIDKQLTWKPNKNFICTKLSRVIYLFKNLTKCVTLDYAISAYFSFFQSIF